MGQRFDRTLDHVRHARHPLRGVAKWSLIAVQVLIGLVLLFAVINLALSLSTFRGEDPLRRTAHELAVLWHSVPDDRAPDPDAFVAVHGRALGDDPDAAAIRRHFEQAAQGGTFLLDEVMVDRMEAVNGRIDARVLPPGVYVGAHAQGPDDAPMVYATKWLAHYLLFPRHAYILVVPQDGPALTLSASQNAKFPGTTENPNRLTARVGPFNDQAYDFPSSGEALHEVTVVSRDPAVIAAAPAALEQARRRLDDLDVGYNVLAPNSNTVVGCLLEEAGLMSGEVRSSMLLAMRAPGIGGACPSSVQGS